MSDLFYGIIPESEQKIAEEIIKPRKSYSKPCLIELGDLRTLTLGGSPGQGDSLPNTKTPMGPDMPVFDPLSGDFLEPWEIPQP